MLFMCQHTVTSQLTVILNCRAYSNPSYLQVNMPQLKDHQRVSFTESGSLQWPLLIQYPEVRIR